MFRSIVILLLVATFVVTTVPVTFGQINLYQFAKGMRPSAFYVHSFEGNADSAGWKVDKFWVGICDTMRTLPVVFQTRFDLVGPVIKDAVISAFYDFGNLRLDIKTGRMATLYASLLSHPFRDEIYHSTLDDSLGIPCFDNGLIVDGKYNSNLGFNDWVGLSVAILNGDGGLTNSNGKMDVAGQLTIGNAYGFFLATYQKGEQLDGMRELKALQFNTKGGLVDWQMTLLQRPDIDGEGFAMKAVFKFGSRFNFVSQFEHLELRDVGFDRCEFGINKSFANRIFTQLHCQIGNHMRPTYLLVLKYGYGL